MKRSGGETLGCRDVIVRVLVCACVCGCANGSPDVCADSIPVHAYVRRLRELRDDLNTLTTEV